MEKTKVTNVASVGIIYRKNDPSQIFLEIKDDGYPIKLGRRQLCFIGGSWIGEGARNDRGPIDTFRRELQEELSFEHPIRNSFEYALIDIANMETFAPTTKSDSQVTTEDTLALSDLKCVICNTCVPFYTFLNTVTKAALDSADQENKRGDFTSLVCYWSIPLEEKWWLQLKELQNKFHNLSNESVTLIISLHDIIKSGMKLLFGHDQVLKDFFMKMGYHEAKELPIVEGIKSVCVGPVLPTYQDYLGIYDVAKKP